MSSSGESSSVPQAKRRVLGDVLQVSIGFIMNCILRDRTGRSYGEDLNEIRLQYDWTIGAGLT